MGRRARRSSARCALAAQVEMRNHTGITLIDRNDELCIMYEKSNIQELVHRQGEVQTVARADEVRLSVLIEIRRDS